MGAARLLIVLVAASAFLGGPSPAAKAQTSQPVSTLAGVQGRALASGIAAAYRPENLLPVASPIDLSVPDALATIASGPSTFARASVADPGDLLANPDALLSLFSAQWPQGTIPPYPFRASASSGVGAPSAESNPSPGLNARVTADTTGSTATANMPGLAAPALATAGSISSTATTKTDGATVTLHAVAKLQNFSLLNIVNIDSVVTDITATSDGEKTDVKGGTVISGATVQGKAVTIDATGVHGHNKALNDQLAAIGISITLAAPVAQDGATAGQLTAAGLHIVLDSKPARPVLTQIAGLVPPTPLVADLLAAATARHLQYIDVARGQVDLVAQGGKFGAPDDALSSPDVGSNLTPPPANVDAANLVGDSSNLAGSAAPAAAVSRASNNATPVPARDASSTTLAAGIGALALLALLAQPLLGAQLAKVANALLAPGGAGSCPQEDR
jgi:hypothetical protein